MKISDIGAILVAILDFRHIGFSEEVEIVKFGFLGPENLSLDILQAIYNVHCSCYFMKTAFWRNIGRHFENPKDPRDHSEVKMNAKFVFSRPNDL